VAEAILGLDYPGTLFYGGWAYDHFANARHQQCLNHLLRRADDLATTATRRAVWNRREAAASIQEYTTLELRRRPLFFSDRQPAERLHCSVAGRFKKGTKKR
jgi:hypothetical protein